MKLNIASVLVLAGVLIVSAVGSGVVAWATGTGPHAGGFVSGTTFVSVVIGTDFTDIQTLPSLPRGSYLANASAVLASNDPAFHFVDCIFKVGGNIQGETARGIIGGTDTNFISLPLTIGFTIPTTQDLAVACRSEVSGVVASQGSPITALSVHPCQQCLDTGAVPEP
jgi:hypothetical protein